MKGPLMYTLQDSEAWTRLSDRALWWLRHYAALGKHLRAHYAAIDLEPAPATIVALRTRT